MTIAYSHRTGVYCADCGSSVEGALPMYRVAHDHNCPDCGKLLRGQGMSDHGRFMQAWHSNAPRPLQRHA